MNLILYAAVFSRMAEKSCSPGIYFFLEIKRIGLLFINILKLILEIVLHKPFLQTKN